MVYCILLTFVFYIKDFWTSYTVYCIVLVHFALCNICNLTIILLLKIKLTYLLKTDTIYSL